MLPYWLPLVGNTLAYWWSPTRFTNILIPSNAHGAPVRVKVLGKTITLITGRENIATVWKQSSLSISTILYRFALGQVFGMPARAADRVVMDDSGFRITPHPESNVAPHNRVDHYVHESLKTFLSGSGLDPFVRRFEMNLMKEIDTVCVKEEWTDMPDFFQFITSLVTPAIVRALCGPFLLEHTHDFCKRFWVYINGLAPIAKGLPRFLYPRPFDVRDTLIRDLQSWHLYARKSFDPERIDFEKDIDPFWGCRMMRERQEIFHRMDDFDDYAIAAGDLGALIGVTSNPIIGSFWTCYETFRDPRVLSRVRSEVAASLTPNSNSSGLTDPTPDSFALSGSIIFTQPMLQSIFAETLRLRMTFFITRYTKREEIKLGHWLLPKNETIFIPTSVAHLDRTVWSEGMDSSHPLNQFWAERFLVYPRDPWSGPKKKDKSAVELLSKTRNQVQVEVKKNEPRFSMEGLYSSWIPFGGGVHICPGRFFSKRQMIIVMALMVTKFDVEFLDDGEKVGVTDDDFGIGVQKPARSLPFRIRRKT